MKYHFEEIIVNYPPEDLCTYPEYRGKPYFSIKYEENGKHYVGFGTYKPEILSKYLKEYFCGENIENEKEKEIKECSTEDLYYRVVKEYNA